MGAQEGHKAGAQDEEVSPQALAQQEMGHKPGRDYSPRAFPCQAVKGSRSWGTGWGGNAGG